MCSIMWPTLIMILCTNLKLAMFTIWISFSNVSRPITLYSADKFYHIFYYWNNWISLVINRLTRFLNSGLRCSQNTTKQTLNSLVMGDELHMNCKTDCCMLTSINQSFVIFWKKVDDMVFHLFLSSADLLTFSYVLRPVHFMISSIHVSLGLPLLLLPQTFPSNIFKCVIPLEPLITCPPYSNFLFFISFMKCKSIRIRSRTSLLLILSFQLIFSILL